ncbi:MAG TPA: YceI family protein, partial [Polyangiaceae bacterium]|nr:YceI family protein [Polyangiaceae bacterium]
DQHNAECRVYTFKEGLLSAVAHDLEIDVRRFEVSVADDDGPITGTFEMNSLVVLGAMADGRPAPGTLSDKDKKKIEGNITSDVLSPKKHPTARFRSTEVSDSRIVGELELNGRKKQIELRRDGNVVTATLHQPDFGIKPFSAMFGTLKIKPDVQIKLTLGG